MPELPEVETSRRGIEPHIKNKTVCEIIIRQKNLRWPIPTRIKTELLNQKITHVDRRGKYLLLRTNNGTLILHLGMSGSLHITDKTHPPEKHDHFDIEFSNKKILRLRDPRRFGAVLWTKKEPYQHKLIKDLGPEPLENHFTAEYLHQLSRTRKVAIKSFIMNSHIVVGVGNIYACESLFLSGISPKRQASRISLPRYQQLVDAIQTVLARAIQLGGTSLRDFTQQDGKPGYFKQELNVYGKTGEACPKCGTAIKQIKQQQRSSFYCPSCQK